MAGRAPRTLDALAWGTLALTASYFVFGVILPNSERVLAYPPYDTYAYFYPNVLHALRSLRDGGGLLWNPYQSAGQPFFALGVTGLLYPVNVVFALFERETALATSMLINLTIGGVGAYALCREMGLVRTAALYGAAAFQLSGSSLFLAAWSPMHLPGYAWLPIVLLTLERLLRTRRPRAAIGLAIAIGFQLLPGFPQTVFFTYQLIALRIAFGLLVWRDERTWSSLGWSTFALVLPVFLVAVQFLPSAELALHSVRSGSLTAAELGKGLLWSGFRRANLIGGLNPVTVLILTPIFSLAAVTGGRHLNRALFFASVAVLYFALAFGSGTPIFDLYASLPLGSLFRDPRRFLFITSFALAMLGAIGVNELIAASRRDTRNRRAIQLAAMFVGAVLFCTLVRWPRPFEWIVGASALIAGAMIAFGPTRLRTIQLVFPALLIVVALRSSLWPYLGQIAGNVHYRHEATFEELRVAHATPNDRVMFLGSHPDFSLMPRSGTVYGIPDLGDYEPQTSRTYAEFFVYMRTGRPMGGMLAWYLLKDLLVPDTFKRPLFDLVAGRFLVVDRSIDNAQEVFENQLRVVLRNDELTIYENPRALPRAFFVPRVQVVPEEEMLSRLASGRTNTRRVALLSTTPSSGFEGSADGRGRVKIRINEPENLRLEVLATSAGFVVLSDQYATGWTASVNGRPAEILRANHAFRAVQVPAGESVIEYRYRPKSLYLGAATSVASWSLALVVWVRHGPRRHPARYSAARSASGSG